MSHTETRAGRVERAALVAVLVTLVLAVAKVAVWAATDSLAVLSQALDSALDLISLGLLFVGVRIAGKPADHTHHYGHSKAENLVAFTQTLFLCVIALVVAGAALARLSDAPIRVTTPWYAFVLLAASAAVDGIRVKWLYSAARAERSDALLSGALNLFLDVGTAIVAMISLLLVRSGILEADAYGGLLVAGIVLASAIRVGKRSVDILMDRAPQALDEAIEAAASRIPGVSETRRVRVRGTGDQLFADVTVAAGRTASLERAHDIAEAVEREIRDIAP
ncbi:MAG TPA: cation diffusion facilitator family transporter, partial [Actinomycetota bacterium]|nr:cation diffusion facilitator family transporter [Actinomycetota bacterium]